MKVKASRVLLAGAFLLLASTSTFAQVNINIGAPGPAVIVGWHNNRYWDGRRWWRRDEWNRYHHGYRGAPRRPPPPRRGPHGDWHGRPGGGHDHDGPRGDGHR